MTLPNHINLLQPPLQHASAHIRCPPVKEHIECNKLAVAHTEVLEAVIELLGGHLVAHGHQQKLKVRRTQLAPK